MRAAEDRTDATVGILALGIGFFLHAVAFVLQIGGVSGRTSGVLAGVVALACTAVAAGMVVWIAQRTHWRRTRSFLIELARHDRWGQRHELPDGHELQRYGEILERDTPGEAVETHARRVWGLDRVSPRR